MMALSSTSRKTLGFGLPGWGSGVTDPISTKPNPILFKPTTASACLSNPAAIPIGLSMSVLKSFNFWLENFKMRLYLFYQRE